MRLFSSDTFLTILITFKSNLLILSESIDMQLFIFLALLPLHVSAPCSHLQVVVAYRWTHLILINVNLVQQDATIQDIQKQDIHEVILEQRACI
jgi:hypothetical protein